MVCSGKLYQGTNDDKNLWNWVVKNRRGVIELIQ